MKCLIRFLAADGTILVPLYEIDMRVLLTTIILTMLAQPLWAGSLVEIQLMDKLDDQRGFCIDIRGHKERARYIEGFRRIPATRTRASLALTRLSTQS
jgi:hypothetical protein